MKRSEYERVCYLTEQRDEPVKLRNLKNGTLGYTFGCTNEGETVQVHTDDGTLDSWSRLECVREN
jgi:hypothetical protein